MKFGIYIPGLGEASKDENVTKYATRFMNELDFNDQERNNDYYLKNEKVVFNAEEANGCAVVTIFKRSKEGEEAVYRFYEFSYSDLLTRKFKSRSVIMRSLLLFGLILNKLPFIFISLFKSGATFYYPPRFRMQLFYSFFILSVIALAGALLIPSLIEVIVSASTNNVVFKDYAIKYPIINSIYESIVPTLEVVSKPLITISVLFFAFSPDAKSGITTIATEFVCINHYLKMGARKQDILGNIDLLIEHIAECNKEPVSIDIHSYSFGSIIALDFMFPAGDEPTSATKQTLKGLITIGCPYDFVKMYFPGYFNGRCEALAPTVKWLNVYSPADALSCNFKRDIEPGESEYSIIDIEKLKPLNLPPYYISTFNPYNPIHFLGLYAIRAHNFYWDKSASGNSCIRSIVTNMKALQLM